MHSVWSPDFTGKCEEKLWLRSASGSCWMGSSRALSLHSRSARCPPLRGSTLWTDRALVVMATCDSSGVLTLRRSSAERDTSHQKHKWTLGTQSIIYHLVKNAGKWIVITLEVHHLLNYLQRLINLMIKHLKLIKYSQMNGITTIDLL